MNSTDPNTVPESAGASLSVQALLGDKPLEGVTVTLRDESGREFVCNTNPKGAAIFQDLPPGSWSLQAESSLENCFLMSIPEKIDLVNGAEEFLYLRFSRGGKIRIDAVLGYRNEFLAGFKFAIKDKDGNIVVTVTTDSSGVATSPILVPGSYNIAWTPGDNYFTNQPEQTVFVSENNTARIIMQFFRCPSLDIVVTNYAEEPLEGALFTLIPGGRQGRDDESLKQVEISGTLSANKDGKKNTIVFRNLRPGKYGIREVNVPSGYSSMLVLDDFELMEGKKLTFNIMYYTQILDRLFKQLLQTPYVLAQFLHSFVSEYEKIDVNDILITLNKQDSDPDQTIVKIRGLSNEEDSGNNGMVYFDNLYCLEIPAELNPDTERKGKIVLFVNIEGESKKATEYTYTQRGIAYISHMITAQRGTAEGYTNRQYQNIKKCYCIFVVINPGKELENTISMHGLKKSDFDMKAGLFKDAKIDSADDLIKIMEINLGNYRQLADLELDFKNNINNGVAIMDLLIRRSDMDAKTRVELLASHKYKDPNPISEEVEKVWNEDADFAKEMKAQGKAEAQKEWEDEKQELQKANTDMAKKLEEMDRIEQQYRELKQRVEQLQASGFVF